MWKVSDLFTTSWKTPLTCDFLQPNTSFSGCNWCEIGKKRVSPPYFVRGSSSWFAIGMRGCFCLHFAPVDPSPTLENGVSGESKDSLWLRKTHIPSCIFIHRLHRMRWINFWWQEWSVHTLRRKMSAFALSFSLISANTVLQLVISWFGIEILPLFFITSAPQTQTRI